MRRPTARRRTRVTLSGVTRVTRYTPQQIETVHALRQQGCTYQRICALTGWSYSAVQCMVRLVVADPAHPTPSACPARDLGQMLLTQIDQLHARLQALQLVLRAMEADMAASPGERAAALADTIPLP